MKNEKLFLMRLNKGYTHKRMGELLNISKSYYCKLENGKRTLSYKMAYDISKILETKPDDIFYEVYNNTVNQK